RSGRRERGVREPFGGGVGVGIEGGPLIARIPWPPAHGDLLGIHRVAHDEIVRGWICRPPGEEVDREVERAPPRVDRGGAATIGRAKRGEYQRCLGGGSKVRGNLERLIAHVLGV